MHPPPSPARSNFTLVTECTPESSRCNSVYSVVKFVDSPRRPRLPADLQRCQLADCSAALLKRGRIKRGAAERGAAEQSVADFVKKEPNF